MTWKLWKALQSPPTQHPLFRKVKWKARDNRIDYIWWLLISLILLNLIIFPGVFAPLLLLVPVIIPLLAGTFFGVFWTLRISGTIQQQVQRGQLDLLGVAPGGSLEACWITSMGKLHGNDALNSTSDIVITLIKILFGLDILLFFASISFPTADQGKELIFFVSIATTFICLSYIDYVQSTVLSIFIGISSATKNENITDARIWAVASFLTIQTVTYALTALVGFVILPGIVYHSQTNMFMIETVMPLGVIPFFFGVRELIFIAVWHYLDRQFGMDVFI